MREKPSKYGFVPDVRIDEDDTVADLQSVGGKQALEATTLQDKLQASGAVVSDILADFAETKGRMPNVTTDVGFHPDGGALVSVTYDSIASRSGESDADAIVNAIGSQDGMHAFSYDLAVREYRIHKDLPPEGQGEN